MNKIADTYVQNILSAANDEKVSELVDELLPILRRYSRSDVLSTLGSISTSTFSEMPLPPELRRVVMLRFYERFLAAGEFIKEHADAGA